jgi:hypothetical protein
MRTPTFWDKFIFYWVNALISGPVTHAKYIGANAAFGGLRGRRGDADRRRHRRGRSLGKEQPSASMWARRRRAPGA